MRSTYAANSLPLLENPFQTLKTKSGRVEGTLEKVAGVPMYQIGDLYRMPRILSA
jgi:hypothetical protein